ncbi:MAG: carbohydrate ABC transporter permease [Phototrophicaceae bacterium]
MSVVTDFLTRTKGTNRLSTADIFTYLYLILGTFIMFGPVVWLVFSSFKPASDLSTFPPRLLPYRQQTTEVAGFDGELPLWELTREDGSSETVVQVGRAGIFYDVINPDTPTMEPETVIRRDIDEIEEIHFSLDNYVVGIQSFDFITYLLNSVIVTVFATILTLIVNSMAAFSLSKYKYQGRDVFFLVMISTLMVPLSVILVPAFLVVQSIGWYDSLLGVIIPGAATPTGVFLLRQYMLTIPDELLDAARIDGASEWRIYAQVILPLAAPALAVLTIFSVMWRWNDFLWPLIVLQSGENFTLQIGLNAFRGEMNTQFHLILAMTVVTLLPITIVFGFLQKYITTGIATTGMK